MMGIMSMSSLPEDIRRLLRGKIDERLEKERSMRSWERKVRALADSSYPQAAVNLQKLEEIAQEPLIKDYLLSPLSYWESGEYLRLPRSYVYLFHAVDADEPLWGYRRWLKIPTRNYCYARYYLINTSKRKSGVYCEVVNRPDGYPTPLCSVRWIGADEKLLKYLKKEGFGRDLEKFANFEMNEVFEFIEWTEKHRFTRAGLSNKPVSF